MLKQIENNPIINVVKSFFLANKANTYIVGGFLRDSLLGHASCDVDIVVENGSAKLLAKDFADFIGGYFVELDSLNNIYRVVFADKINYVDIADCVGGTIAHDLTRRDFTINALAYDIKSGELIDVVDGLQDLKQQKIREISEFNIKDDAIRILRAYRFKSELGFNFSDNLTDIICKHANLLNTVAKERINAELIKLFAGKNAHDVLISMDKNSILQIILPCVSAIKKIPPNSHHHLPLFEHCVETVAKLQEFYEHACDEVKQHLNREFLAGHNRLALLKFAAFLHDIGKPDTWQIEPETGRHRFIMHDSVGAKIVEPMLKDLKFSKKQIAYVQKIIKNHIYPAGIVTSLDTTEKTYLRFYRKMEDEVIDLIAIAYADRKSALGPDITPDMLALNINGLKELLDKYLQHKSQLQPLPKLLNGKEIMDILHIQASPQLGEIINLLNEAQISSLVNTKDEAIAFVKQNFKK